MACPILYPDVVVTEAEGWENRKRLCLSVESLSVVGARRLELPTPCTPCKCASQLRHAPIVFVTIKNCIFL